MWRWPPTPYSAEVKERVELYFYPISGPSWPVIGWTLRIYIFFYLYSTIVPHSQQEYFGNGIWNPYWYWDLSLLTYHFINFLCLHFPSKLVHHFISKTDSGTQIVRWCSAAWSTTYTLPLSEHWPPDATSKLRPWTTIRILPLGRKEGFRKAWVTNRHGPRVLVRWISRMNVGKFSSGTKAHCHFKRQWPCATSDIGSRILNGLWCYVTTNYNSRGRRLGFAMTGTQQS